MEKVNKAKRFLLFIVLILGILIQSSEPVAAKTFVKAEKGVSSSNLKTAEKLWKSIPKSSRKKVNYSAIE